MTSVLCGIEQRQALSPCHGIAMCPSLIEPSLQPYMKVLSQRTPGAGRYITLIFFFKKIFMKLRFWNFIFKVFFLFPLKGLYIITKWNPLLECENGSTDKTQSTWYVILIERRKATKIISADPTNESDRRKSYFHLS